MHRSRAAEGEEREPAEIEPLLRPVDRECCPHVGRDDAHNAGRGLNGLEAQRDGEAPGDGGLGAGALELHRPPEER